MKRQLLNILLLLFAGIAAMATPRVYMLTIDDEIDATAWQHTRRAVDEACANGRYDLFLLRLNTYGGAVDMADSIHTALMSLRIPTVAFIDHNAASAGALIALSCDTVYMTPGAIMGAATVVGADGEPMPQKYQSYWSSIMRATAMNHGKVIAPGDSVERWRRDPDLAQSMVDPTKAVSLTATEALRRGMSDGILTDVPAVLSALNLDGAEITAFSPTFSDNFLGFIASAGVRAILIMLIIGGLYMEMHTPGLGFAGAVATIAAVLYFLPVIMGGHPASWILIAFVAGVILLALEIFVIPGFGIAGVSGILAIIASLMGVMMSPSVVAGAEVMSLLQAFGILSIGVLLAIAAAWYLTSKHGPKCLRRVASLSREQRIDDGYIGVDMTAAAMVGRTGKAVTDLRPAGKVDIDGTIYDATSTRDFIPAGSTVKVVRYEAAQIYVEL